MLVCIILDGQGYVCKNDLKINIGNQKTSYEGHKQTINMFDNLIINISKFINNDKKLLNLSNVLVSDSIRKVVKCTKFVRITVMFVIVFVRINDFVNYFKSVKS